MPNPSFNHVAIIALQKPGLAQFVEYAPISGKETPLQIDPNQVNEHVFPKQFPGRVGLKLVHAEPGKSECKIDIEEEHLNAYGVVHGGATYTLADTGMFFALLPTQDDNELSTTVEIKMTYYKAVRDGSITCKTDVIKRGKRIAFLESELRDDAGDIVARASGTYYIIVH